MTIPTSDFLSFLASDRCCVIPTLQYFRLKFFCQISFIFYNCKVNANPVDSRIMQLSPVEQLNVLLVESGKNETGMGHSLKKHVVVIFESYSNRQLCKFPR